ncbi:MAG TPA: malate dehydrogenase [Planctomycetes bacterium]|nr:malate dehydrogenase [Planctomycetota bacterium]
MARTKIAVIGGGQIGGNLALYAAQRELGDVVIYDVPAKEGTVAGKALDIAEQLPVDGCDAALRGTSRIEDIAGAAVVIVTAGVARTPGMTREDLLAINLKIIASVAEGVAAHAPGAFCIIVTNPLDAMVHAFQKLTGFPHARVCGMAGVLDTARFRAFIAMELGVSVRDVSALVLGGHGPTMVPISRLASVGGVPVAELIPADRLRAIEERTREAGTEIVKLYGSGSAYYSPAMSAIAMAESCIRDQKRVLPAAAYCRGEYGIDGLYAGVPAVIGAGGVERILQFALAAEEEAALAATVRAVRQSVREVEQRGLGA